MKRDGWNRGRTPQDGNQLALDWGASAREKKSSDGEAIAGNRAIVATPSVENIAAPESAPRRPRRRRVDVVGRLPVPRPLPGSIEAGHFGYDDDGKAIRPQADEIRAITEALADRLIELLDATGQVKQENARQTMQEQFAQAIQMYALEFGERPARQLEAYVRRQSALDEDDRSGSKGCQR